MSVQPSPDFKNKVVLAITDIRFWIMLFFLVRLYGITFPPLELRHTWRQTDGLMIARNFYETDANIFYPRVDSVGEKSGIVGSEFPILNYLIYLIAVGFGYEHWYGRLIVLVFSSVGVFCFYRLIKRYLDEATAFNASILLMASLWFSFSRKIIPDVFAASLCLMSLYFAFRYLESGKFINVISFFILGLLGCLSKILAATLLTVLLLAMFNKEYKSTNKILLSFFSALILTGVCAWYFFWVPFLNTTFGSGDHFFMGVSLADGMRDITNNWMMMLRRLYITPLKYAGCIAFIGGIFFVVHKKNWLVAATFFIPYLAFLILLVKTGANVVGDEYYILTMIPAFALISGWGLASLASKKIGVMILIVVSAESIGDQVYDFNVRESFKPLENLELIMERVSDRDDLIAVNGEYGNPTFMYFAHRRGWVAPNKYLLDSAYFNDIVNKKCKYVVVAKQLYGELTLDYPVVHDSVYFRVYKIQ